MATEENENLEDIQHELQELAGLDGINDDIDNDDDFITLLLAETLPSIPALRNNVPEVRDAKASFVYNFFQTNEKEVIINDQNVIDVSLSTDSEIFFEKKNDRIPRFVKISFKPPSKFDRIKTLRNASLVSRNLDKIIVEGGVNNNEFSSFELTDTEKDTHLYNLMNSSAFLVKTVPDEGSPADAYKDLQDAFSDEKLTGTEKGLVSSALKGIQSKGYRLAPSDIPEDIAATANDLVSRQNFSLQINNLVFDQIIESATRIPDGIFQDEFRAVDPIAKKRSSRARLRKSNHSETELVYAQRAPYIDAKPVTPSGMNGPRDLSDSSIRLANKKSLRPNYDRFPKISHTGYLIKKLEVLSDGTHADRGFLVYDNPDALNIIDKNVRYGGVYVYSIRSIYLVETIAETVVEEDHALDNLCMVRTLISSEGSLASVECIENEPPPPPQNLRISFDRRSRQPFITWQFPVTTQRDVKRFQVFKRLSVYEPFMLITEYDFDNSTIRTNTTERALKSRLHRFETPRISFLDDTWESGQEPIYAVACVDAHGMSSNLSAQIRFKYDSRLNKVINTLASYPNAPKPYPNLLLNNDTFDDAIKVSGYERMRVYFDPEYYKVFKNISTSGTTNSTLEDDQNFLRINQDKETYKIHILNVDLQKDKTVGVKIGDFSGSPLEGASPAEFDIDGINL
mgnify:CR=1 FL=1